jgi:uncharacterized protein (DUF1697 family)
MTSYVALLRGINVGGKNLIKMPALKASFEEMGFGNVATLIQSGNVLFDSPAGGEKQPQKLEIQLEAALSKTFDYNAKVIVRSSSQIQKVLKEVPPDWKHRKDIRCYIAFLKDSLKAEQAIKEVELREEIDSVKAGDGVLYLTSLLSALTKSKINKIASLKIYQDMTIRNYNTTQKIAVLLEKQEN